MTIALEVALPNAPLPAAYFACRYACLREPLGFPEGAERLADDAEAIHAWWQTGAEEIVAVGRIHRIQDDPFGLQADHAGPSAAVPPAFSLLASGGAELRPAVQIRQMGTRNKWRKRGLAGALVAALEAAAINQWGAKSGWLQSRLEAVAVYASEDWIPFGEDYVVESVGVHRSMWKLLDSSHAD